MGCERMIKGDGGERGGGELGSIRKKKGYEGGDFLALHGLRDGHGHPRHGEE